MKRMCIHLVLGIALTATASGWLGCACPRASFRERAQANRLDRRAPTADKSPGTPESTIQLASLQQPDAASEQLPQPLLVQPGAAQPQEQTATSIEELEASAIANNPTLRRLRLEASAEFARVGYVGKLPDPTVGAMAYAPPMEYDPDRQPAEVQVAQMIPWLGRLRAETRQAHLEALAASNEYQAERLQIIGDMRAAWYQLYVLNKQVEITNADRAQLQSLLNTANARVRAGDAQPGDVLFATLELSSIQEQLLTYKQQIASATAELNRLAGRTSQTPIEPPPSIEAELPAWNHEMLRATALQRQPELYAARLRAAAARWGIEVARLRRRPDLTFGANWMIMDAPGAVDPNAGRDSVALGVSATIPLWHRKYDAMFAEASRTHRAASASEEEVALRLDALLRDLWEQAQASQQTVELYKSTILPQARQTFEANQASLINNTVAFDRVVRDFRTVLTLELGYHRALGQLATALARIRQTVGDDLVTAPQP